MDDKETAVDGERCINSEPDLGAHLDLLRYGEALLIAGPEELVDEFILAGVVLSKLPLVTLGMLLLHLSLGDIFLSAPRKVEGVIWVDGGGLTGRLGNIFMYCTGVLDGLV